MAHVRIDYTHKRGDNYNPHERIQGVAGNGGGGWYRTEDQVLADLGTGLNSYFVKVGNVAADVIVARHEGRQYIKTQPDGYAPNNLLNLDEPPVHIVGYGG
ncbi:MAG TPA: DUF3892 domain-containing protein [Candidatus Saccharimonadales bacterium]